MKQVWQVILSSLFLVATYYCCYKWGEHDGINDVVQECNYYRKYAIDGTQFLLCSGIVMPEDMIPPSVEALNKKLYSKENKDKHKKDRK